MKSVRFEFRSSANELPTRFCEFARSMAGVEHLRTAVRGDYRDGPPSSSVVNQISGPKSSAVIRSER